MVTAILVGMALALFHFIYESIVAPDLRLCLTLKLCALHNEVSALKASCADTAAGSQCVLLQESINALISGLDRIRVSSLLGVVWKSRKDPGFLTRAQLRARMLDECSLPRVREIHEETLHIAAKALAVNCIIWVPLFVVPWIVASVSSSAAKGRLRVLASLEHAY